MKGLRRSFKSEKRTSSSAGSSTTGSTANLQKSQLATLPPKKIIKAKYDYNSQGPGELGFQKGDFLYVVGNENDADWYEACDPPSNLRGMVPVTYFEVVSRNDAIQTIPLSAVNAAHGEDFTLQQQQIQHQDAIYLGQSDNKAPSTPGSKGPQNPLYGVVLYDFDAERPDELQAKKGESIIVIAQSNEEWFVAKPIGRLGGPGLIPISFVQIRDLASDQPVANVEEAIRTAGVPRVEEWKRMAAEYKASSIPLGRFDDDGHNQQQQQQQQQQPQQHSMQSQAPNQAQPGQQQSHHVSQNSQGHNVAQQMQKLALEENAYPRSDSQLSQRSRDAPPKSLAGRMVVSASVDRYAFDGGRYWYLVVAELSDGRFRNLCRYYQDFYDFQIKLLDEFPEEAGRTGKQRTLPFMPGPLTYVNDSISSQRRANLDDYVRNLIAMPSYISQSPTVQHLFALRTGDIETPHLTNTMPQPPAHLNDDQATSTTTTSVADSRQTTETQATDYNPSIASTLPSEFMNPGGGSSLHQHKPSSTSSHHVRATSEATVIDHHTQPSPQANSRNNSPSLQQSNFAPPSAAVSPTNTQGAQMHAHQPSYGGMSMHTSNPSESFSMANGGGGTPTSTGASPLKDSFIKVKVFHEDDLIAIRVPASVTFDNLQSRISERLGLDHVSLMHKDDATGDLDQLTDDIEFTNALGGKNKLVLYAK